MHAVSCGLRTGTVENSDVEVYKEGRKVQPKVLLLFAVNNRGDSFARRPGVVRAVTVRIRIRIRVRDSYWV